MDIGTRFRKELIARIGQERYELWFTGVQFIAVARRLSIVADKPFRVERLRRDFLNDIRAAAAEVLGQEPEVDFSTDASTAGEDQQAGARRESDGSELRSTSRATVNPESQNTEEQAGPDQRRAATHRKSASSAGLQLAGSNSRAGRRFNSLDSLIVGDCNRLARTSADMIIQQLGEVSPLVIHGPNGVGKTHLLEGIWSQVRKSQRRSRVVYLSAEQFTSYFLEALKGRGLPSFRRKYRDADLLIIDDIQFFAGKQATTVELASTMDHILREGNQLIMSADRPPVQLQELGAELAARLSGGVVCGMQRLDEPTSQAVLRQWARQRDVDLPESVVQHIAKHSRGDARQLSGVLNRLRVTSQALSRPVTVRMAEEILDELLPPTVRIIRLRDIERAVCEAFGLPSHSLQQDARTRTISRPRMLAMWLARKHTSAGLAEISEYFGRRSHSTVVSAQKKVNGWLQAGTMLPLTYQSRSVPDIVRQLEADLKAG